MKETKLDLEYFEQAGLRNLNESEEAAVSLNYRDELISGLAGKPKSVAMYPSMLSPVEPSSLMEGSCALVVEIGGTNLYGAQVRIEGGKPIVVKSHRDLLPTTKYRSAREFYSLVAQGIEPVLRKNAVDALAIVYSFPGKALRDGKHVDVISPEDLPKEFVIPGISKKGVGESFRAVLYKNFGFFGDVPTVVLNDTVAVLFSAGAKVGGVVGTGFNLAMDSPKGIINSESGGFAIEPIHRFARAVDKQSGNLGRQLAEKQISGLYLGEEMKVIVVDLGLSSTVEPKTVTSETISEILADPNKYQEAPMLLEAAVRLRDRSAQIVGIMIGTIINTFGEVIDESTVEIPIEGSLFWGMLGYEDRAREVSERLSHRKVQFLNIADAGRIGAAVAALGRVHS